ncbi:MAG: ABC transporter ATP-binding protein [Actinomycetota bacterium]|nr:ABC transporter ATP-binding protein [Actinomycetota bacterium]
MSAAIRTDQLVKRYEEVTAVDHVDLEVRVGEVFGFLGSNGAGKSTTIRCILDLGHPTTGTISVLGLDSHRDSLEIRRRVGYLPGDLALYSNLTGQEVVDYFANLRGGVDRAFIAELAERFRADLSRRCRDYSSGNRQKVGLIQAFMHRPDLVILDEPSTGLDPLVQQELQNLITEVRADGRTVFLSSHTLSEVERIADRVGIIRHGRLIEVSTIDALKAKAIRRLDIEFDTDVDPAALRSIAGVRDVTRDGYHLNVSYDGPIEPVLEAAIALGVVNLHSRDADLEQIFLAYYREPGGDGSDGPSADDGEVVAGADIEP